MKTSFEKQEKDTVDGSAYKIGIAVAQWNAPITNLLKETCMAYLMSANVAEENIHVIEVPGSFELPFAARMLMDSEALDGVICLGCVVQGETKHDDYINHAIAHGITTLSLASGKPVIYGVVTTNTMEQALARVDGSHGAKGTESAMTALRMISLNKALKSSKKSIGF